MNACRQMGLAPGQPAFADCATRLVQTYTQAESADNASRRAAFATMNRPVQPIQIQQQPPPGVFVPQVTMPTFSPR